jgi:hypothetical protein
MNQASPETTATDLPPAADPTAGQTLTIIAGDEQTAALVMTEHGFPMATFDPVAAELRDASGGVLAGEPVAWSVGETPGNMGVQMDPMGTSPCIVVTDDRGVSTLDQMRGRSISAFYDHGPFKLLASHGSARAAANLFVAPPPTLKPKFISGDNQSVARSGDRVTGGEAVFGPVQVLLKDTEGNAAPGVTVAFEAVEPKGMTVRLSSEGGSAEIVSDAEGLVTLNLLDGNGMVARGASGEFKIIVTPKGTKPIISHHTVAS